MIIGLAVTLIFSACGSSYEAEVSKRILIDQDDAYPGSNAKIVDFQFPDRVESGKEYPLKIVFQNTGETPWLFMSKYQVGFGTSVHVFGGKDKFKLPAYVFVKPGEQYEFVTELKMPTEPDEYFEHFRMVRFEEKWFGEGLEIRGKFE